MIKIYVISKENKHKTTVKASHLEISPSHSLHSGREGSTMASSVLKIPLIFASAALHHKAFTSPNPAPTTQRNYQGFVEKTLFRSITFVTVGQKVSGWKLTHLNRIYLPVRSKAMAWLLGFAEAAVYLASRYPDWPYSNIILEKFMFGGDPKRIGMTAPFMLGTGMIIAGGLLRWYCYRALGKMFTYEVSVQHNHQLITTGPYTVVR